MASVPAHSLYGESASRGSRNYDLASAKAAPPGGMPFIGHTRCMANEGTCQGARAKGTDYCIGHLRQILKETSNESG